MACEFNSADKEKIDKIDKILFTDKYFGTIPEAIRRDDSCNIEYLAKKAAINAIYGMVVTALIRSK